MIRAEHLFKAYGDRVVLQNIHLQMEKGEVVSILGPSGTGKSTLLRIFDLLEQPDRGSLQIFGEDATRSELHLSLRRRMAMLFQKPAIFNTSVWENVALGLRYRNTEKEIIDSRVQESLEQVGLSGFGERRAKTLSGGETQRLALARALVTNPEILFLDEPTAHLDPQSAEKIEQLILDLKQNQGFTMVVATHDLFQAQRISDRIAVLMDGVISQVGMPEELFQSPGTRKVARYMGVENILPGVVIENQEGATIIDVHGNRFHAISPWKEGDSVFVCIRGEAITLGLEQGSRTSARNVFSGTVRQLVHRGPLVRVKVDIGTEIIAYCTRNAVDEMELSSGKDVVVSIKATGIHVILAAEVLDK